MTYDLLHQMYMGINNLRMQINRNRAIIALIQKQTVKNNEHTSIMAWIWTQHWMTENWSMYLSEQYNNIAHMMTSSNGNILRVTGPLCLEFPGHRWIPLTKANNAEL